MYLLVWEFRVRPGCESTFESVYGPSGDWTRLFGRAAGYEGSELVRDAGQPERYLVIDRWASRDAFRTLQDIHAAAYETLDRRCEALTLRETSLGSFERVESAGGVLAP